MEAIGIDEINRLKKENEELHKYVDELKEQVAKSVSNDLTLISVKEFCRKVLNGEV